MYPLKFHPILKSTIWGGEKIVSFKHLTSDKKSIGESWDISEVKGNVSVVANGADAGKSLTQLMQEYKSDLVGKDNYERFEGKFPLLIKFIDAKKDLSIQVHPSDHLAKERHHSMGKSEMWFVIDGTNNGRAHLCPGINKVITTEEYLRAVEDHSICNLLADYEVKSGDVFYLPAGRIHCIGAGCFIAEIQQTSDITYRIYDYNRKDVNGKTRELHTELSEDAIDFSIEKDYHTNYTPKKNKPVELVNCEHFTTYLYDLTENMTIDYSELDSFVIFVCVEGGAMIYDNGNHAIHMQAGESLLIPATIKHVEIKPDPNVKFLETYV